MEKHKIQNPKSKRHFLNFELCAFCFPRERGFTFVETLVAIAILLLGVVAPLALTYQSLAASRIARNQITATFLAEEGIEYVRAVRDSNTLNGSAWLSGLSDCLSADGCMIDETAGDSVTPCEGACAPLLYNSETAIYGYETGTTSPFTRTVVLTETVVDQEANIAVVVSWPDGTTEREVLIDETIFNWQ